MLNSQEFKATDPRLIEELWLSGPFLALFVKVGVYSSFFCQVRVLIEYGPYCMDVNNAEFQNK